MYILLQRYLKSRVSLLIEKISQQTLIVYESIMIGAEYTLSVFEKCTLPAL